MARYVGNEDAQLFEVTDVNAGGQVGSFLRNVRSAAWQRDHGAHPTTALTCARAGGQQEPVPPNAAQVHARHGRRTPIHLLGQDSAPPRLSRGPR
eukprot:scaffold50211_cov219-Isochrysis_galbana.AAC.2